MGNLLLFAGDGDNDAAPFRRHHVGPNLIQIKNNASDVRIGAVLRGPNLADAIGANWDVLCVGITHCVGKIQQDAVRLHRGVNRGLNRSTECDLNS